MESRKIKRGIIALACVLCFLLSCQLSIQPNPFNSTPTAPLVPITYSAAETSSAVFTTVIVTNVHPTAEPVSFPTLQQDVAASPTVFFATSTLESSVTSIPLVTDTLSLTSIPIPTYTPANVVSSICPQLPTPTQVIKPPLSQKGKTPIPPTPSTGCLLIRDLSPFTITFSLWSGCSGTLLGGTSDSIVSQGEKLLLLPPGCYGLAAGQTVRMNVNIISGYTTVVDVQQ